MNEQSNNFIRFRLAMVHHDFWPKRLKDGKAQDIAVSCAFLYVKFSKETSPKNHAMVAWFGRGLPMSR